jgi:hypothetical protein
MGKIIKDRDVLTEASAPGLAHLKQMAPNFVRVNVGETVLYFSYETLVAFEANDRTYATAEKYSRTTSKHINLVNVDEYLEPDEFEKMARKELGKFGG